MASKVHKGKLIPTTGLNDPSIKKSLHHGPLLAHCRGLPPSPFLPLMSSPHLCLALPGLLAFHARPLSNPWEEADGPSFLCTNQGRICSLTDTSPLTLVSSQIHYSSLQRWTAEVESRVEDEQTEVSKMLGELSACCALLLQTGYPYTGAYLSFS